MLELGVDVLAGGSEKMFAELMGLRSLLPLMYVLPSAVVTTYEFPSFLFLTTWTCVSHLPVM